MFFPFSTREPAWELFVKRGKEDWKDPGVGSPRVLESYINRKGPVQKSVCYIQFLLRLIPWEMTTLKKIFLSQTGRNTGPF